MEKGVVTEFEYPYKARNFVSSNSARKMSREKTSTSIPC
ncbi:hypothetical protein QR98_0053820 [Sarcoptes scabiei]|uniref:Uncharacterized protein n=1 Tax=Sarcoptes scabiei TaxID=52283 RepID=A0A132A7F1_SARSC|nr:hypothetical protein QR98_0053820 [Sarcoptes scabiei]